MELFDFWAFQNFMKMLSHDKIIFHMLFWASHITPRIRRASSSNSKEKWKERSVQLLSELLCWIFITLFIILLIIPTERTIWWKNHWFSFVYNNEKRNQGTKTTLCVCWLLLFVSRRTTEIIYPGRNEKIQNKDCDGHNYSYLRFCGVIFLRKHFQISIWSCLS